MQDFERIDLLMNEVGPLWSRIESIHRQGSSYWSVELEEDLSLHVDFDATQQQLVLCMIVGQPIADDLFGLYQALLQYNSLHKETGGVTMCVGDGGLVQQVFALPLSALNAPTLLGVLQNFVDKALAWREVIHASPAPSGELQEDHDPSIAHLRV